MANEALDAQRRKGGSGWLTAEMESIKNHLRDHYEVSKGVATFTRSGIFVTAVYLCASGEGLIKLAIRAGVGGSMSARRFPNYKFTFVCC